VTVYGVRVFLVLKAGLSGCLHHHLDYSQLFPGLSLGAAAVGGTQTHWGLRIAVRAIPTTSAPSHIYETCCHVAQTCLIIKEMGPERSHINVSDPI